MWSIFETKDVTKSIRKLPRDICRKYKVWVEIVRKGGADNLINYPGFKDKKLKGKLRECRSSRLNIQYRVVYIEDKDIKEIVVLDISPHNYSELLR